MKKSLQLAMNEWVENAYEYMQDEMKEYYPSYLWKKLRSCQADVLETKNFYVLRSYNTIVACIRKDCLQSYDFLRMVFGYTATSAQHISKFFKDYGDSRIMPYVYRDI